MDGLAPAGIATNTTAAARGETAAAARGETAAAARGETAAAARGETGAERATGGGEARVSALDTPALLVDADRLERNITRWQQAADAAGVRLRPHIKTHKSVELAALQRAAGASGIAVAKTGEAEVFAAAGFDDIAIAYPVVGAQKWQRIARLARQARITLNIDSAAAVEGISAAARDEGATVHLQIDIDSGFGRCGVPATDTETQLALANLIASLPGVALDGVTTHRGLFFPGADSMTRDEAGRGEGEIVVAAANRLREAGHTVDEVTAGGSLSGAGVAATRGVTEVRAGTYVFNDLMQIALGAATHEDLALTVLATVVSITGETTATIDCGSKTFAGDSGVVGGTGLQLRGLAECVERDVVVERMTEEHGLVRSFDGPLAVGDRLTFVPVHACTCVNLSERLHVVRNDEILQTYAIDARGRTS
jgi:D-serine deaminase-like pyridoxal phosphate-dependent protein